MITCLSCENLWTNQADSLPCTVTGKTQASKNGYDKRIKSKITRGDFFSTPIVVQRVCCLYIERFKILLLYGNYFSLDRGLLTDREAESVAASERVYVCYHFLRARTARMPNVRPPAKVVELGTCEMNPKSSKLLYISLCTGNFDGQR